MRYALALAALPVVVWAVWSPTGDKPAPSRPVVATAVATEGVRAQRQDVGTFRLRWSVVSDLPPAVAVHYASEERTGESAEAAASPLPPARLVKRAALRVGGICAKHGMRKVTVRRGKWQGWRCRR